MTTANSRSASTGGYVAQPAFPNVCEGTLRQIPSHRQRGGGQRPQRRRHDLAPAGRAQCGREQRGHPRRLAYSSKVAQRHAQFAFLCGFSLRITDVSNAFVRSSADSTPGGQRQSYLASTSSKPSSLKADLSNVSVRVQPALAPSAPMSASANEPLPSLSAIVA